MSKHAATDSLGSRIIAAARLATAAHLEEDHRESSTSAPRAQAMIGGTDRRVTDDHSSAVSGPLLVDSQKRN